MSDYNSSLPVRTESAGDVIVKVADATVPSQQLAIDSAGKVKATISQGGNDAAVTGSNELKTLATAQPGVDIGDVTINNTAGAGAVNIQDGGNSITVDGTVAVSNLPATVDTNYGTVGANTPRSAAQIGNSTGAANFGAGATGAQTLRVEANQGAANATPWNQNIAQIAGAVPSATNPLPNRLTDGTTFYDARQIRALTASDVPSITVDSAVVSKTNPMPVYVQDSPGTEVNDYNTQSALASSSANNHDYVVTALNTFRGSSIWASASGKLKIEVQVETGVATGSFITKFVGFNSTSNPNIQIPINELLTVAAGVRVRVIRTNLDKQPQDVYSTISGHQQI